MPSVSKADLPEEAVRSSAEQVSDVVQSEATSDTSPNIPPLLISDVSAPSPVDIVMVPNSNDESQETSPKEEGCETAVEIEGIDPDTGGYILPSRMNRGVPPKRYTPERINRKARYSVVNLVKGHLTKMAQAFEEAL